MGILLTPRQAGEYLGRTESAIRQLIFRKELPVVRIGRNVRLDRHDLDRIIDEFKT
ncbi:MAG TPA: helix-turn-helix domain-containing protein [Candidatus Acidoferrales bacterium]|nr:helix-turn-helix domain-containing protein [Candidatus Acidoferrales bacterium]